MQQLVDLTIEANDRGNYFPVRRSDKRERGSRSAPTAAWAWTLACGAFGGGSHLSSRFATARRVYLGTQPPPALPDRPPCAAQHPLSVRRHSVQLHGVCLGMEALSVAISRNHSILSDYDSENLPSPLFLTGGRLLTLTCYALLSALSTCDRANLPLPLLSLFAGCCTNSTPLRAHHFHVQTSRPPGAAASSARCRPKWWSTCKRGPMPWRTMHTVGGGLPLLRLCWESAGQPIAVLLQEPLLAGDLASCCSPLSAILGVHGC